MRKIISLLLATILVFTFGIFALGSGKSSSDDQGSGAADATESKSNVGEYTVEIKSCRIARNYDHKSVVIVTYGFTNNSENSANFEWAFDDTVYQKGVGLNPAFVLDEGVSWLEENATKDIQKGATVDVEKAYILNDTTTDIEVEVKELFSFGNDTVKKTFKITQ